MRLRQKLEFNASRPHLRTVPHFLAPAPTAVKLQPDRIEGVNAIFSTTHDAVSVNNQVGLQQWRSSVIVPFKGDVVAWACTRHEDLTREDFDALMVYKPELVIFGSGPRLKFVSPALTRALIERRIGVETMDTAAACRTYNVLVSEGRSAVAALLLCPPA